MECPAARSSMIRGRAASLPGAVFGPGLPETKNSRVPARKSRTADSSDAGLYPNRAAASAAGSPSAR